MELKQRILRYVLVLPGKVRVTASADDDGTMPEDPLSQLDAATYKFSMSVKIPQYLVLRDGEFGWERPYYWFLEQPSTLLSVCTVNKELHQLGRSIFYGENYFEVLDDSRDHRIRDWLEDDSCAGPQLTHRWLELMGAASSRDKCPRYGETPLTLLRTLNIDLWPYKGEYFAQTDWHFERIVNALLPVPGLRKLVINVRVTALEMLGTGDSLVEDHPQIWPGFCKLPWGASMVDAALERHGSKVKVYIPEHRRAQKWLQELIDMPDNAPAKLKIGRLSDWHTDECPPGLINGGVEDAEGRMSTAILGS
jgi:hypothetical protein